MKTFVVEHTLIGGQNRSVSPPQPISFEKGTFITDQDIKNLGGDLDRLRNIGAIKPMLVEQTGEAYDGSAEYTYTEDVPTELTDMSTPQLIRAATSYGVDPMPEKRASIIKAIETAKAAGTEPHESKGMRVKVQEMGR